MTVADLSVEQFEQLVRTIVKQVLLETLTDPDEGLELREEVKSNLLRSMKQVNEGAATYSAEDVAARAGLSW
jgi:hypothetical protein